MKTIKTSNTGTRGYFLTPGRNEKAMVRQGQVLCVTADAQGRIAVTLAENPESVAVTEERTFYLIGQADPIPTEEGTLTHLGSVVLRGALWHVFEVNSPEDRNRMKINRHVASPMVNRNEVSGPVHGVVQQVGVLHRRDAGVYIQ